MNKLLIATALVATSTYAAPFEGFTSERHRLQQSEDNSKIEPLVGRNLVSVVLTDIFNIFLDPSWSSLTAAFVDITGFFALPMLGGYVNATVFYNYEKDPLTF